MLYKYNKRFVGFVKVTWPYKLIIGIGIIAIISIIAFFTISLDKQLIEKQVILIISKQNQFNKEKLIKQIKDMHFNFPYIVYAQSWHETNNFTSGLFTENNNLFAMKKAEKRIRLYEEGSGEYAYYINWTESVYDYGFLYASYLSKLQTEDDYYSYLSQYYAEDTLYVSKVKTIIKENNLKSIFN